ALNIIVSLAKVIDMSLIHEMMLYALARAAGALNFTILMALNPDGYIFIKIRVKKEKVFRRHNKRISRVTGYIAIASQVIVEPLLKCYSVRLV
ncbi:hypothetical protein MGSAQ_001168, partial [marine sediment metagenome]|nr:hypothetical protein [Psychrobacter sp.]